MTITEAFGTLTPIIDIDLGRRMLRIEVPVDTDKVRLVVADIKHFMA